MKKSNKAKAGGESSIPFVMQFLSGQAQADKPGLSVSFLPQQTLGNEEETRGGGGGGVCVC
jgi:hypothetical protein